MEEIRSRHRSCPRSHFKSLQRRNRSRRKTCPEGEKNSVNYDILTTREIAEKYGVSTRTVHRWLHHEKHPLPHRIVGRAVIVSTKDMKTYAMKYLTTDDLGNVCYRRAQD